MLLTDSSLFVSRVANGKSIIKKFEYRLLLFWDKRMKLSEILNFSFKIVWKTYSVIVLSKTVRNYPSYNHAYNLLLLFLCRYLAESFPETE